MKLSDIITNPIRMKIMHFLMALYGSFQRYSDKENTDPATDMLPKDLHIFFG